MLSNTPSYLDLDCIYPKYSDKQAWANWVDLDQMLQNKASDQGLHFLPHLSCTVNRHINR